MSAKMTMLVRRFYEEIVNNPELDKLDEILDPRIIWHDPLLPAGEVRGVENFKNILEMFRSAFPDLHITVKIRLKRANELLLVLPYGGTHREDLMGLRATGRKFKVSGISIIRFEHGKAAGEWIEEDVLGLMRQLGVVK